MGRMRCLALLHVRNNDGANPKKDVGPGSWRPRGPWTGRLRAGYVAGYVARLRATARSRRALGTRLQDAPWTRAFEPAGASAVLFEDCYGAGLATTRAIRPDTPSERSHDRLAIKAAVRTRAGRGDGRAVLDRLHHPSARPAVRGGTGP